MREIVERAERNGLQFKVRSIPNDYGMPFFAAFVFDTNNPSRKTFNGGWACDLERDRALVRAVTEAAQSRVAFIHGGRKVSTSRAAGFSLDAQGEAKLVRQHMLGVSDPRQQTLLTDIPDLAVAGSLQQKLDAVIGRLRRVVQEPIYRVVFTPPRIAAASGSCGRASVGESQGEPSPSGTSPKERRSMPLELKQRESDSHSQESSQDRVGTG